MSDMKDLQTRLNERADSKLKEHIAKAFKPMDQLDLYGVATPFVAKGNTHPSNFRDLCYKLQDIAFEALRENWRQAESAEFISKVESLGEQLDELRDGIAEVSR